MLKIAVIGGDGIGPEVCKQGIRCLDAISTEGGFEYQVTNLPYGGQRYLDQAVVITDDEIAALKTEYDAIYLGAVGRPDVPPGVLEQGLLLRLRFDLDQYINLRPVKLLEGIETPLRDKTPQDIDFVVVRENTEDLYCGMGGFLRKNTPHEVASQEMIATRMGVERCLRYAFELCNRRAGGLRGKKKLTLVGKTNVLTYAHDLWMRTFNELSEQYNDVPCEYHHVDACCMYMVTKPEIYDVIVTTNMFGDIITDLGAAIAGGMGIAASGNLNPEGCAASMFEPVHGSAPDIAGQNKANPIAAILSMAMLLEQTGLIKKNNRITAAGTKLEAAVVKVCSTLTGCAADKLSMTTEQVGDLVLAKLQ